MEQQVIKQYSDQNGVPYLPNVGARILNLLNGVKHTVTSFSQLYGLDPSALAAVTRGEIRPASGIRAAIEKHYPLRIRDLYPKEHQGKFPVPDDTLDGVVIHTAEQTKKTERNTFRGPEGRKALFYTYADTAMSTTSLFRPEWIAEHFVHNGVDAESVPDWAFNNGHFEHQITYFIGPVNFHWIDRDNKMYVRQMNTGDTNYITPYVRHSFTTRKSGEGLILAVTYGGTVATESFQSKIQSMSLDEYFETIREQISTIGQKLATDELRGVIVGRYKNAPVTQNANYSVATLVDGVPFQPYSKSLEYTVKSGIGKVDLDILIDAERWGYNTGDVPILLLLGAHKQLLEPGSSFFIQPNVPHAFRNLNSRQGRLVVMEIKPEAGDTLKDLALIQKYSGQEGLERVHSENKQWF